MKPRLMGSHRRTYDAIFRHPAARNLQWRNVRAMRANKWKSVGIKPRVATVEAEEGTTDETSADALDLEQIARDEIARLIEAKYSGQRRGRMPAASDMAPTEGVPCGPG